MRRAKLCTAGLVAMALAISACGGDDDSDSASDDAADSTDAPDDSGGEGSSDSAADPSDDATDDSTDDSDSSDDGAESDEADDEGDEDDGGPSGNPPGWAGELVMRNTESATMDPAKLATESSQYWDRAAAIYDTLLRWDPNNEMQPQLAESMETDDGVVWTLKLRPDVTFTDGTPLDAEAVVYNIERQQDPANACGCLGNLADVQSIDIIDPLTVQFTLGSPNGSFNEGFSGINGMIGSPTAIEADPEGFGNNPVGAGPYVLDEWVRDDHVTLVRNPDYWDPTRPAYETIVIRMIPDPIAAAEALRAGEVDLAFADTAVLVQLGDPEPLGLRAERADGMAFVLMNHSTGPTQDVRVREAISLAFDPARVNAALLNGLWESEELVCPPYFPGDPECVPGIWPEYDVERARSLIDEYAAEGNSVDISLLASQGAEANNEFIQLTLNDIGLNVEIDSVPGAEWLTAVNEGDYELSWYAVGVPVNPRMDYLFRGPQRNIERADQPEYDDVVLNARITTDPDERLASWERMQEIIAEEFMFAWFAPFISSYVLEDDIDYGDQVRSVKIHLSQLAPSS